MNANQRFLKLIRNTTVKSSAALLIVAAFYVALLPVVNFALTSDASVSARKITARDDAFDKKFREGRDLIDKEEWAKAAEKFNELIEKYPNDKSADAALYWLAFCYKKQKKIKETEATLDRLLKDFPASSWSDDARVMKLEIGLPLGKVYDPNVAWGYSASESDRKFATEVFENAAKGYGAATLPGYVSGKEIVETYSSVAQTPLDREDEIRIAAFQSLLAADPQRAIATMGDILRSNSKASESLKQEVLRALRSPRLSRNQGTINLFASSAGVGKQFLPLLRDTLVKSFQNETNIKIRKEIIYALANVNDDQSAEYLSQLYASESDREIKKAIINSFSGTPSNSFFSFSKLNAPTALSVTNSSRKIEFDKLMEIVRTEKDVELRRFAFSNLQRFGDWNSNEKNLEVFSQMYDAETDEQFKMLIVRSFSNLKQPQSTKKLLEIAKNDKSDKLRLEAIYALRTSNNPEVLKFLEELIK